MNNYIDKLNKSKEVDIIVEGFTFTIRRPSEFDISLMHEKANVNGVFDYNVLFDSILVNVVGWNLNEIDVGIPGGSDKKVKFDIELFMIWSKDNMIISHKIADKIKDIIEEHIIKINEKLGNSEAG